MKTILVLGAGLSSTSLIKYFLDGAKNGWKVRVGDINPENFGDVMVALDVDDAPEVQIAAVD